MMGANRAPFVLREALRMPSVPRVVVCAVSAGMLGILGAAPAVASSSVGQTDSVTTAAPSVASLGVVDAPSDAPPDSSTLAVAEVPTPTVVDDPTDGAS